MESYYIWINREQDIPRIDQEDISFLFHENQIFTIRPTYNTESDDQYDYDHDEYIQSNERLPPVCLQFRFQPYNKTVLLSCDPNKDNVWLENKVKEIRLLQDGRQLMWDVEYQIDVLKNGEYVSMLLMVTKNEDQPSRTPSRPSTPETFQVGRVTPQPERTPITPMKDVTDLLYLLQSTFHPNTVNET